MTPEERQRLRLAIDRRRRELCEKPRDGLIHGRAYTYNKRGCRCRRCTSAANDAKRAQRKRRADAVSAASA